jgi:Cu2+-exporting ATPase
VREVAGEGVFARHGHEDVALARPRGLINLFGLASAYRRGEHATLLSFADALRPDAVDLVDDLKQDGLAILIASGDRPEALEDIARATGTTAIGHLRPTDKLALIERLK